MKYIGSKARLAKHILPFIEPYLSEYEVYVEPFVGGCNMMDKVKHKNRVGFDGNYYLIEMWKGLQNNTLELPDSLSKEEYLEVKTNRYKYRDDYLGFVGHNCSFSGDWFAGYAGTGESRNRCGEAKRHLLKQIEHLRDVSFVCDDYKDVKLENALVYCDPPYLGGFTYKGSNYLFDHREFWDWCRETVANNCLILLSDYDAPKDFELLLDIPHKVNAHQLSSKNVTEKLYKLGGK